MHDKTVHDSIPEVEEKPSEPKTDDTTIPLSMGFSTGRGKTLANPSSQALAKAKALLETPSDITAVDKQPIITPQFTDNTMKSAGSNPFARTLIQSINGNSSAGASGKTLTFPKKPLTAKKSPKGVTPLTRPKKQAKVIRKECLFSMTCPEPRFTLRDYFGPEIPFGKHESIRLKDLTIIDHVALHKELIAFGANELCITNEWTKNHVRWIKQKISGMIRCFPEQYLHEMLCHGRSSVNWLTVTNVKLTNAPGAPKTNQRER